MATNTLSTLTQLSTSSLALASLSIQHSRGCAHISRCVVGLLPRRCWAARRPTCSVLSVLISCVLVTRWLSALMYLALAGTPGCGIVRLFEP